MKKTQNISGILVLVAVYCFGIGLISTLNLSSSVQYKAKSHDGDFVSAVTNNLFSHLGEDERDYSSNSDINTSKDSEPGGDFSTVTPNYDLSLFDINYSTDTKSSGQFIIAHHKAKLLFPFHYYW
ncbi:hypothetical protein [Formosa sp. S-31]|uniref:hypothetical protein n=1 Tax=Formosa sp. S-31 TaxID=2790949 RepID=UPI003EBA1ECC